MTEKMKEPALFVGEIDDDMDLSLPPASGEEYIKRVVIEAQQCEDVVVANMDVKRLKTPTIAVQPLAGCLQAPASLSPALDWQQCQLTDFSTLRLNVTRTRNEIGNLPRSKQPPKVDLPSIDDENEWIDFCTNVQRPSLTVLLSMNQPLVEQVLEYLVERIKQSNKIHHSLGEWMYALLAVLEVPLTPDTCSCLRTFARVCSTFRANMVESDIKEVAALNLFICLVARYFRQMDLVDS